MARKLGPYEIRSELGRGAMAQVWRAYDAVLDREGETVGVVEAVQFDLECGDVATITVRLSGSFLGDLLGSGETVEVPGAKLDEFWEGRVRLALSKEQLKEREF